MVNGLEIKENNNVFYVSGAIDANLNFSLLRNASQTEIALNLKDVKMINSIGIKKWYEGIQELQKTGKTFRYQECSIHFIWQFSLVSNMREGIQLDSFNVETYCEDCDEETPELLKVAELNFELLPPPMNCRKCGTSLSVEPEDVFRFLKE